MVQNTKEWLLLMLGIFVGFPVCFFLITVAIGTAVGIVNKILN